MAENVLVCENGVSEEEFVPVSVFPVTDSLVVSVLVGVLVAVSD